MRESTFKTVYSALSFKSDSISAAQDRCPDVKRETIEAIYRRKFQYETMKNIGRLQKNNCYESVLAECLSKDSIAAVSDVYGVSTCALARFILKALYPSDKITEYLRTPSSIPDAKLKGILELEIDAKADLCHPDWDAIRRAHGEAMEEQLAQLLQSCNILYYEEKALRSLGYPKTPDFKLPYPIGLLGEPVCWIESKALFGDEWAHAEYSQSQYQPYINRFGPGAVVYWHGFIDGMHKPEIDGVVVIDGDAIGDALRNAIKII